MRLSSAAAAVVMSLVSLTASVGRADDQNKAAAQALYDEGVRLMEGGQVAEGCRKLESSNKLFQGVGVRGRLGDCYEKLGSLASAWAAYRSAQSLAESKGDTRADELRSWAQGVELRMSHIVIDVPASVKMKGMTIRRDGVDIPEALWGTKIPVDGGLHKIEVSAPDRATWSTPVVVKNEKDVVNVPVPALKPGKGPETGQGGAAPPSSTSSSTRRNVAFVVGGAGIVGLGVGGIFGLKAMSKNSDSNKDGHCNGASVCDATGLSLRNDSRSAAGVSTVFTVLGAAALTTGIVLYVTRPSDHKAVGSLSIAPQIAREGGGFTLGGSW